MQGTLNWSVEAVEAWRQKCSFGVILEYTVYFSMKDKRTKFGSISSSLSFFHPSKLIKDRRCEGHRFALFLSLSFSILL